MAISDSDKIDFLWKKVIYGVTKTASGSLKFGSNESISSPLVINPSSIWSDAGLIPPTPPLVGDANVELYLSADRIKATSDASSQPNRTWLATTIYNDPASIANNWIPVTYGPGYIVAVYIGDPSSGPATRIFPDTLNEEYVFDYSAGVLTFTGNIPQNKSATIGSGTISVATHGIYLRGYRYVGATGGGGGGGTGDFVSKTGDTMTGALVFDFPSEISQTLLLNANSTSVSGFGSDVANSTTRFFRPTGEFLSFGQVSTIDGVTYTEDVRITDGGMKIGGSGDGLVSTDLGNRIVIGHTDPMNPSSAVTEDMVVESNGVVYILGYEAYHHGNLDLSNAGVLTDTGVIAGSYSLADITVDRYGRITHASNGSASGGGVTSVGITGSSAITVGGSPITTSGVFTVDLSNTGVSAGTYTKLTVDTKGRVTAGSALLFGDVTAALGYTPGTGSVTSVSLTGSEFVISGSPITSSGTISLALATTGVSAGTYSKLTVDTKGRVTAGGPLLSGDITNALGYTPLQYNETITLSGDIVTASGTSAIGVNLAATGVVAGTYTLSTIVVDAKGRITFANSGVASGTGTVTSVSATGSLDIAVSGSPITTAGTLVFSLINTAVTPGTYSKVTVDSKGRVTLGQNLSSSDVTTALGYTPGQGSVTSVSATGSSDISVSGSPITSTGTLGISLSNTSVSPGTYTVSTIVVDAKGRITNAVSGVASGTGTVTSVNANSTTLSITGGPVTASGTISINLNTLGSVGTYAKVVTDAYGRVASGSALSSGDVTTALGFTPLQNNETATLTGDITGSGATSISTTLSNTGVSAGTYTVSTIVVDSKGRITNAVSGTASGTGTVTSVSATGSADISVSGSPITTTGTLAFSLSDTGVSAGTYTKVTVDTKGRITLGQNLSSSDVTTALGFTPIQTITNSAVVTALGYQPLQHNENITFSAGDVTGSGSNAVTLSLTATGVSAGTYTKVTVDTKGRITAGASLSSGDVTTALGYTPLQTVTNSAVVTALGYQPLQYNESITLSGDIVTASGTSAISVVLSDTGVSAGSYSLANITIDSKGRIVSASNGTASGSGTVTSVAVSGDAAIDVSGSPITASGTIALSLNTTGVQAGEYTLASITVDSQGRITSASNGSVSGASGGTVTSVAVSGDSAISVSGSPITNAGTIALSLSNTGVSAGTYTKVTVDAQGRVTAASSLSSGDVTTALGFTPIQDVTNAAVVTALGYQPLQHNENITFSAGDVTGSGSNAVTLSLTTTGVSAGAYTKVTVDTKGRVTAGESLSSGDVTTALGFTPGQGTVTSVDANSTTLSVSGGPVTSSGTIAINLNTVGTAGTYSKVVTDEYGRVSSGSALSSADVTTALGYTPIQTITNSAVVTALGYQPLQNNENITFSAGDVTGSGTNSVTLTLTDTGVAAGTYAKVTVDAKGRVTAGGSLSSGDVTTALGFTPGQGTVTSINANSTTLSVSGGPVTSSGTLSIDLNAVGTAGTYTKVVTDEYGRVSSGSALSSGDVTTALGFTPLETITNAAVVSALGYQPLQHNENITFSAGDVTGSGANAVTLTLTDTGVVAGTYAKVTVDAKGRVTAGGSLSSGDVTTALGFTPLETITNAAVVSALGYQPLQYNETATLTGDITGSGTTSIATTLTNTGVTAGTYTNSTIVVDAKGRISLASSGSTSGASIAINKANASIQSSATTLNFTGNGVTVTNQGAGVATVNVADRVEFAYFQYGPGGSGNFTTGDNLISNSANMAVTITDGTNCFVKFTFTGYTNPPIGIAVYGQSYATNQFTYNAVNGSYAGGATRVVTGGGTASAPTFMTTFTDITLSMKMADTGASASVGQRSHAYIVFKF